MLLATRLQEFIREFVPETLKFLCRQFVNKLCFCSKMEKNASADPVARDVLINGNNVCIIDEVSLLNSLHDFMKDSHSLPLLSSRSNAGSGVIRPASEGIGDVHPSLNDNALIYTNKRLGKRCRRNSRCFRYISASKPTRSPGFTMRALGSNAPSSWASANARLNTIHDICSKRFVGSTTSCFHVSETGTSSIGNGGSRASKFVMIKSESQPSVSGGNWRCRGNHSVINRSASMLPMLRIFALDIFS